MSVLLVVAVVGAIYGAWKFAPPYIQRGQVSEVLAEAKHDCAKLDTYGFETQRLERDILAAVFDKIVDRGIPEEDLEVYFDANYDLLIAEYSVVVHHPFGQSTTLHFTVEQEISSEE